MQEYFEEIKLSWLWVSLLSPCSLVTRMLNSDSSRLCDMLSSWHFYKLAYCPPACSLCMNVKLTVPFVWHAFRAEPDGVVLCCCVFFTHSCLPVLCTRICYATLTVLASEQHDHPSAHEYLGHRPERRNQHNKVILGPSPERRRTCAIRFLAG